MLFIMHLLKKLIFLYNHITMELSEKKLSIKSLELFAAILMLFKKIINNIFKTYSAYVPVQI